MWEEQNLVLRFRTKINNSTINVECDIDNYKVEYFTEIHERAFDLARAAANLACFAHGDGVTAVFEFVILPDGAPSTLRLHDPSLPQFCTSYTLDPASSAAFGAVANIVVTEPPVFAALNDLIESITVPHASTINCGRVIDSIRRLIAPSLDGIPAWEAMHRSLNISRPYQEFISKKLYGSPSWKPRFHSWGCYWGGRETNMDNNGQVF
jgi:hypothetical protein